MDLHHTGIFEVKQFTGVIEIYIWPTPVAMVTKMWKFSREICRNSANIRHSQKCYTSEGVIEVTQFISVPKIYPISTPVAMATKIYLRTTSVAMVTKWLLLNRKLAVARLCKKYIPECRTKHFVSGSLLVRNIWHNDNVSCRGKILGFYIKM